MQGQSRGNANVSHCNILLFLFASLFCIFFLRALSSTLVQSSFSFLLYLSLTCKSLIAFAPQFRDNGHIPFDDLGEDELVKGMAQRKATGLSEMSEMSEISANLAKSRRPSPKEAQGPHTCRYVGICLDFLTFISTLMSDFRKVLEFFRLLAEYIMLYITLECPLCLAISFHFASYWIAFEIYQNLLYHLPQSSLYQHA